MDVFVYQEYKVQEACLCLAGSAIGECCFGFFMASYYAIGRRKYQLPRWEEIGVTSGN